MEAEKLTYTVLLPVDADGTPLHHGERVIEVSPGEWVTPLALALERYLEGHGGERR
jgi:hypothetical protein